MVKLVESSESKIEIPDVHTASDDYKSRFAGTTGRWMLEVQKNIVLSYIENAISTKKLDKNVNNKNDIKILDIGGGHGQISIPLSQLKYKVTVLCSSLAASYQVTQYLDKTQKINPESNLNLNVDTGSLYSLPYSDYSFDFVTVLRLLCHTDSWKEVINESLRVAKYGVIIDYPNNQSLNILTDRLFGLKKKIEKNTRTYTLFSHQEIIDSCYNKNNLSFEYTNQFFVPMIVHRVLGKWGAFGINFSKSIEAFSKLFFLTKFFGSPTILLISKQ